MECLALENQYVFSSKYLAQFMSRLAVSVLLSVKHIDPPVPLLVHYPKLLSTSLCCITQETSRFENNIFPNMIRTVLNFSSLVTDLKLW